MANASGYNNRNLDFQDIIHGGDDYSISDLLGKETSSLNTTKIYKYQDKNDKIKKIGNAKPEKGEISKTNGTTSDIRPKLDAINRQ